MAKYDAFSAPGNNPDFDNDAKLVSDWNRQMSDLFDTSVASVSAYLAHHGGGTCQLYNPASNGRVESDLAAAAADIPWNGFPKRYGAAGPGQSPDYAGAEAPTAAGSNRDQDEYLEWFVKRENGKIVSIQFTCEAWDYFD